MTDTAVLEERTSVVESTKEQEFVNSTNTEAILLDNNSSVFITYASTNTVLVERDSSQVVTVGAMGPAGKDGVSEDSMPFSKRIDFTNTNIIYKGEAMPGTLDTGAVWRISRIEMLSDDDVLTTWASGNANFDKVWSDRLTYTYT